jgi:aspartate-semialdehyde dehydrogenase
MGKIAVGILGANGTVGQRFVQLLRDHPIFEVVVLGAGKSAGTVYKECWRLSEPLDPHVADRPLVPCEPTYFKECQLVFSALDAQVAGDIELLFVQHDIPVFSNGNLSNGFIPLQLKIIAGERMFLW